MGGEGAGKSFHAALYAVCHSIYDKIKYGDRADLYWIVGKDFEDANKEWAYIKDFMEQLGNVGTDTTESMAKDQQKILSTLTGQQFVTISAYDFGKLGREEPFGIIGAEFTRWEREAFDRCTGRLARKAPNSWGFFSGSYESSLGWLPDLVKMTEGPNELGIRSYGVPAWANLIIYPGGRDDPAILMEEQRRSPQKFMERFGGIPAPPENVVFNSFRTSLHVDPTIDFDNGPAYLAIDPGGGQGVYAVEFVQLKDNGEVWVLDEVYVHAWSHEAIINECRTKPCWPLVVGGAIDIAATQRHMGLNAPLAEWKKDTGLLLKVKKHKEDDTIEKVRATLMVNPATQRSRLRIHPRCEGIISEFGGGTSPRIKESIPKAGPWVNSASGKPKDENNHATKALGYLLLSPYGYDRFENRVSEFEPVSYMTGDRDPYNVESFLDGSEAQMPDTVTYTRKRGSSFRSGVR